MTGNITVNGTNIFKRLAGTTTSGTARKQFYNSVNYINYYYWELTFTGFKQVVGVAWAAGSNYGHAVSGTAFNGRFGGNEGYWVSGGEMSSTHVLFPCSKANEKVWYYIYGIAS